MTDATPAEIMRRIDELVKTISDLVVQMREDRLTNAQLYLRREFYEEARKSDQKDIGEVAKDVEETQKEKKRNDDFKRTVALGFALFALTTIASLGLALTNFLAR